MGKNQIKSEKDVEMKVVLNLLKKMGYKETDWVSNY